MYKLKSLQNIWIYIKKQPSKAWSRVRQKHTYTHTHKKIIIKQKQKTSIVQIVESRIRQSLEYECISRQYTNTFPAPSKYKDKKARLPRD